MVSAEKSTVDILAFVGEEEREPEKKTFFLSFYQSSISILGGSFVKEGGRRRGEGLENSLSFAKKKRERRI